jgi:hypothetical protein
MYWLTTANGGPLKEHGTPITPVDILATVGSWGLVLLGLSVLILAVRRFVQGLREGTSALLGD